MLSLLIVALLALGFVAGCGSSSDDGGDDGSTGTVVGTVTDQNSQPISGALCTVTTTGAKGTYSDTTDDSGVYEITSVPEGVWPLTISADGFVTQTEDITVVGGDTTEVPDVEMPVTGYGDVAGTVTSDLIGGTTIAGATVTIGSTSVTSGTTGGYTITDVAAGTQTISATATGYVAYSSTVTVVADTTVTKDIAMTPSSTTSPTPSPGYGNVAGKVVDVNGAALADVTVTLQKGGKGTTDSSGNYLMENLNPGVRTLSYAKTGYTTQTKDVTVEADTTVTAPTVTLLQSTATGVTTWVSKRINLPEAGDVSNPDVSSDGTIVVFQGKGNVVVNYDNPTGKQQVYVWSAATGTITRLSNNKNVVGSTAGANQDSQNAKVSGDGAYVVFDTIATDILPTGLASGTVCKQVYIVKVADLSIARISNKAGTTDPAGTAVGHVSENADINGDGSKVVFSSLALNNIATATTADYRHVYYCEVSNMVPGVRRMLDSFNNTEGAGAGASDPRSDRPSLSYDGRYTAFQSRAINILASGNPGAVIVHIYRNDIQADPTTGWNILASRHNGELAGADCTVPSISEGGSRLVFLSASTNLGYANAAGVQHVYLWNLNSTSVKMVDIPLSGTERAAAAPTIDRSGQYVAFLSSTNELVAGVTNNANDANGVAFNRGYVKDVDLGQNVYTLVTKGSSDQIPALACANLVISGDGNSVVFDTKSKNLTTDSYTVDTNDVFIRKWK
jgi:hypothetical protein